MKAITPQNVTNKQNQQVYTPHSVAINNFTIPQSVTNTRNIQEIYKPDSVIHKQYKQVQFNSTDGNDSVTIKQYKQVQFNSTDGNQNEQSYDNSELTVRHNKVGNLSNQGFMSNPKIPTDAVDIVPKSQVGLMSDLGLIVNEITEASAFDYSTVKKVEEKTCFQRLYQKIDDMDSYWEVAKGAKYFQLDNFKMIRALRGETEYYCSNLKTPRWVFLKGLVLSISLYIFITEYEKLGTQKSQTIEFHKSIQFNYHYSDALPLHAASWWYVDRVFNRIQEHQQRNRLETDEGKKFREYRDIPLTWDVMDWHDKRFIEEYLCNRTRVYYVQNMFYDVVIGTVYNERFEYDFPCELLDLANDKIRTHYWVPVLTNETYSSTYNNDLDQTMEPICNNETVFFQRSTGFTAQVRCEYDDDLQDLKTWYTLFHTTIGKSEPAAFNYWNFTSDVDVKSRWWDTIDEGFWFAQSTTMLVMTVPYYIGQEQIQNAYIGLQPEKTILKDKMVTKKIFGIAYGWADELKELLIWKTSVIRNDNSFTDIRRRSPGEEVTDTAIISNIDFEYTERVYNIHYYGISDMLSKIGGLKASLGPLISILFPFFTISFLYTLAGIIQGIVAQNRYDEMLKLIKISRRQFLLIQNACENEQIIMDRQQKNLIQSLLTTYSTLFESNTDNDDKEEAEPVDHNTNEYEELAIRCIKTAKTFKKQAKDAIKESWANRKHEVMQSSEATSAQLLRYILEPIFVCAARLKSISVRNNQSRIQFLQMLKQRVDFFRLSDLYDRVDIQTSSTNYMQKIQERHSDRLRQMEYLVDHLMRSKEDLLVTNKKLTKKLQKKQDKVDNVD